MLHLSSYLFIISMADGGSNITTSDDQRFAPDCANNNTSSPASEDQSSRK